MNVSKNDRKMEKQLKENNSDRDGHQQTGEMEKKQESWGTLSGLDG